MSSLAAEPERPELPRRLPRAWWLALIVIPISLGFASWYFTASLEDHQVPLPPGSEPNRPVAVAPTVDEPLTWPDRRVEGEEAKATLLRVMERAVARVERVEYYTAKFLRQERVGGVLGPEIVSTLKVRNHPFAIYLKYRTVKPGKEVVYAEGHHDNKVIAHNGDWTRKLIPRLAVAPDSPLALADSRHPVTDAGLLSLSRKLLKFRRLDLGDADASTVLDRTTAPDGRPVLRSVHHHSKPAGRPFCHVEIWYDPETLLPFQISSYDWPAPGQSGPLDLAERYLYEDLKLDAPLSAADFDPANPEYAFTRP